MSPTVVAKIENMNPLWSVKDRIARAMIDAAERDGLRSSRYGHHRAHKRQYRHRSGLCLCGPGIQVEGLTMPESMTIERRRLLKALGAEVILTPAAEGMNGAVETR